MVDPAKTIEQTLEQRFGPYGTKVDYITHNDPSHHWTARNLNKPGLYMSQAQIVEWVAALQARIAEEGLRSARVSAFDNDRFDRTLANLDFRRRNASAQSLAAIGKINPRPQYGLLLRELRQLVRRLGKEVWTVGGGCCNGKHFAGVMTRSVLTTQTTPQLAPTERAGSTSAAQKPSPITTQRGAYDCRGCHSLGPSGNPGDRPVVGR